MNKVNGPCVRLYIYICVCGMLNTRPITMGTRGGGPWVAMWEVTIIIIKESVLFNSASSDIFLNTYSLHVYTFSYYYTYCYRPNNSPIDKTLYIIEL